MPRSQTVMLPLAAVRRQLGLSRAGMDAPIFTAAHYERLTSTLDEVMALMTDNFGKTEEEAGKWLLDFVEKHYLPVWRNL